MISLKTGTLKYYYSRKTPEIFNNIVLSSSADVRQQTLSKHKHITATPNCLLEYHVPGIIPERKLINYHAQVSQQVKSKQTGKELNRITSISR
jgi:hypothetical protein